MILRDDTPRGLSRLGWALMLVALALMPLMPTLVRSEPKPSRGGESAVWLDGRTGIRNKACVACHSGTKATEDNQEDLHGKIIRLMDALKKQRDQAAKTEQELKEAVAKFEKAQEKPRKEGERERLDQEVKRLRDKVERLQRELEKQRPKPQQEEVKYQDSNAHYQKEKAFEIPFAIQPGRDAKRVSLFRRRDAETKWTFVARSKERKGVFPFTAPDDGVYQFYLDVEGHEEDRPGTEWKPSLTVVVDTVRPVITGMFRQEANKTIQLNWSIKEAHPDLSTLRIDYRTKGMADWEPLAITSALDAAHAVRFDGADEVDEVRFRMKDKAGNEGVVIVKR